ncbi:MAG TPA: penicillin-binding protein 1C [Phnomibacter sp.]|nr:penicillin-binding protein 1C [Phnomibacter sp.]
MQLLHRFRQSKAGRVFGKILRIASACFLLFMLLNIVAPPPAPPAYSTIITDADGRMIHAYLTPDEKWRMKTELTEISPLLQQTIVHKEDRWFYYHPGINPVAILRAMAKNIWRGRTTSGASTITMQVVRLLEPRPRNLWSKGIEAIRSLQMEWKYSKAEILQLYLNLVPMGGNIEGIKSASWLYFNKNPDHLSLAELTALSIIPNRPVSLRMGRNNNLILQERNRWLQQFAKDGLFDSSTIHDALQEPLDAVRLPVPRLAPHLSQKLRSHGATSLATTLRMETQAKVEKLVADYVRPYKMYQINHAAVVIINNQTHAIEAYVGSADFADTSDGGQVNGATAIRQPGSTLKPLLYGLCIDAGMLTPKMMVNDVASNFGGYVPENYDQRFNGAVSMEYALSHSLNIPAVKMLNRLGLEPFIQTLVKCRFEQVAKDEKKLGLSMILGGCGTTLEELTGLFSVFANNGQYYPSRFLQTDSASTGKRILSKAACYMLHDMLSNMERPDFPLHWQATGALPRIAWKTGTSYGRRDAWSIGYNKHYTVGVWVGNFKGQGIPELSGASIATPLLFRIFNTIDYNSDKDWYTMPAALESRIVCTESGLPPSAHCTSLTNDFFIQMVSPTATCNLDEEMMVSPNEKISYCAECAPATGFKRKWYRKPAPELKAFYDAQQIVYEKIPPHNSQCSRVFDGLGPLIVSPDHGAEYFLEKEKPEPILLQCQAAADVSRVYWYINNRFFKSTAPGEKTFFIPEPGMSKISCTDDKGRNRDIRISVTFANL